MSEKNHLGQFIRAHRKHKKLTQRDLGRVLGVSPQTVSLWENGDLVPAERHLPDLARALGVALPEIKVLWQEEPRLVDIAPLVRTLAKTKCETITLDDLRFLINVQDELDGPMAPPLAEELLKHRRSPLVLKGSVKDLGDHSVGPR